MIETRWEARKRAFRHPAVRFVVVIGVVFALLSAVRAWQAQQELLEGQRQAQRFAQRYLEGSLQPSDATSASDAASE